MSDPNRKFRAKMRLEHGEWTRDQVDPETEGLSDAWFFASVIRSNPGAEHGDPGSVSTKFYSMDGFSGQGLDWVELFKIWSLLGRQLGEQCPDGSWQQHAAKEAFQYIRRNVAGTRGQ